MGADCGLYINDVPTVFVSLENPYHLLDFPRVRTYINCYSGNEAVVSALIEKLTGRSEFKGKNPVDPFCGKWMRSYKFLRLTNHNSGGCASIWITKKMKFFLRQKKLTKKFGEVVAVNQVDMVIRTEKYGA